MNDSLALFDHLVRSETRLYHHLDCVLRDRHDLVTSQFEFLRFIRDHDRARVGDLAANFAVGVGATSKGIDRLERLGLVRRLPNPDDRRSSILTLSPKGADRVSAAERTVSSELGTLTDVLTASQRVAAADSLLTLRAHLESQNIGTPLG